MQQTLASEIGQLPHHWRLPEEKTEIGLQENFEHCWTFGWLALRYQKSQLPSLPYLHKTKSSHRRLHLRRNNQELPWLPKRLKRLHLQPVQGLTFQHKKDSNPLSHLHLPELPLWFLKRYHDQHRLPASQLLRMRLARRLWMQRQQTIPKMADRIVRFILFEMSVDLLG